MYRAVMTENARGPIDKTSYGTGAKSINVVRSILRNQCMRYLTDPSAWKGVYVEFTVYFKPEGKQWVKSGMVVGDSSYRYGRSSGIFWIPKGKDHEGYRARGIAYNGSLKNEYYKLT